MSAAVPAGTGSARASSWARLVGRFLLRARGLVLLAAVLGTWQLFGDPRSFALPPPSTWWAAGVNLSQGGGLAEAVGYTMTNFVLALAIASVLGAAAGLLIGGSPMWTKIMAPYIEFFRVFPVVAIIPAAALTLGYNRSMVVLIVVVTAVWPVLLAVADGRRRLSGTLRDVSVTLGVSSLARTCKFMLPAILPDFLTGVRIAAPLALIGTLAIELVTGLGGLGAQLFLAQNQLRSREVWALVVVASAVGWIVNAVTAAILTAITRRRGISNGR